jgi:phosphoglycolate phosphatase
MFDLYCRQSRIGKAHEGSGTMRLRIVFDLDGTLIDSAPDMQAGANQILAAEGVPPLSFEEARSFIGHGVAVFVAKMRDARGLPDSEQARLLKAFTDQYDTLHGLTRPYAGVPEALGQLRANGHRLAICTNKPLRPTRAVLQHLGLIDMFETIWGGDSLPVTKPDPAPLHAAIDSLGKQGHALFVGDSEVDAKTAMNAGVPFALFTEGYREGPIESLKPTFAFSDYTQLSSVIGGLYGSMQ